MTNCDFHAKRDMPVLHYTIFPELIIPSLQYSIIPIVNEVIYVQHLYSDFF